MNKPPESSAVVLFDGVCNLCNSSVHFILDRDRDKYFRFASLQSRAGKELLAQHGLPPIEGDPDSVLLLEGGRVHSRSGAALHIARRLGFPWVLLVVGFLVPWFLRDLVYKFIARNRYRWFGKTDACRVPTPELRERFLA